jgi:hypothetical protein
VSNELLSVLDAEQADLIDLSQATPTDSCEYAAYANQDEPSAFE